jgi:hypothetical protein
VNREKDRTFGSYPSLHHSVKRKPTDTLSTILFRRGLLLATSHYCVTRWHGDEDLKRRTITVS